MLKDDHVRHGITRTPFGIPHRKHFVVESCAIASIGYDLS